MRLGESKTRIFFDMHLPYWPGKGVAERFDPERIARAFAAAGADSAVLYAKCQYGNFYTRLEGESLHPGLGGTDLLEELARRLAARGIESLAYYSVAWDEKVAEERPDWLTLDAKGERGRGPSTRWRTLCINGPYADLVERHVAQIARKGVGGIWLDMTVIGDGNCHCERCRASYAERFGGSIPSSPEDPAWADFLRFRYDLVEAFYRRIKAAALAASPGIVFTNNYWGYPYSSTGMGSRAVGAAAAADFVTGEAYSDWTGMRTTSFLPLFLRSVAGGRSYEALVGRFVNTWDFTVKPKAFLAYEAFSVFAQGATVTVDDQPYHDGRIDEALYEEELAEIFGSIRAQAPTVRGRPARYAAVYHSQRTRDACADQAGFVRAVVGAFRVLRELKLPVEFLFDESLAEASLEGLRLIVLPILSDLSAEEWALLESFAASGGLVVFSGSLGSGSGSALALSALGLEGGETSECGLSYLRLPGQKRDLLVRGGHAAYRLVGRSSSRGIATGSVVEPICDTGPGLFFHNNLPAPYAETDCPALVEARSGSGGLALFPQPIFSHYAKEPSAELRGILSSLIARRLPPPRVEIRAPLKVEYAVYEEEGGGLCVHLLCPNAESSLCCGLMDTYDGAFERSYEYMEEALPVHGIEILVHGEGYSEARALREGSELELEAREGGLLVRVLRVTIWEIIRIGPPVGGEGR